MSSPVKKVAKFARKTNLLSNVMDKAGVGKGNLLRKLSDPAGDVLDRTAQDGFKGALDYTKEGGMTDPLNLFHKTPDNSSVEAPPAVQDGAEQGVLARDRIRRRAYRAQGRASTIRSTSLGSLGSGSQLLGS